MGLLRCAGVRLDKNLMKIAGNALKANITTLGPLVLPLSEQLLFFVNLVARKVGRCTCACDRREACTPAGRAQARSRRPPHPFIPHSSQRTLPHLIWTA